MLSFLADDIIKNSNGEVEWMKYSTTARYYILCAPDGGGGGSLVYIMCLGTQWAIGKMGSRCMKWVWRIGKMGRGEL
jgi:hypothetical protein